MNARTYGKGALLAAAGAACFAAACNEPAPKCTVALGAFAATYTLVSGTGPCAMLTGEVLNVQEYNPAGPGNYPNYDIASVAIEPSALVTALSGGGTDPNASDLPYGLGTFSTSNPASNGFCTAPTLNAAHVRLPAVAASVMACTSTPAQPAVDLEYDFSNVAVLSTARALGTQLFADLTYTDNVNECTATYKVAGVYPSVSCGAAAPVSEAGADVDAGDDGSTASPESGVPEAAATDGASADSGGGDDAALADAGADAVAPVDCGAPMAASAPPGPMVPDLMLCSPTNTGNGFASGISPDYDIRCDPTLLLCVLNNTTGP